MEFAQGSRVVLKTFLGSAKPQKKIKPCDNYWKLIGEKGKVIDDVFYNGCVLVLFDNSIDAFELANHNPAPNSLWIKVSDLEIYR